MTSADRIREAARDLREFSVGELSAKVEVQTSREHKSLIKGLHDFRKRGEIERIRYNSYVYRGRTQQLTWRQRFWDVARRMRQFTTDDIEQITSGHRQWIREFLRWMVREGYAQRLDIGHYKTIGKLKPVVPKGEVKKARKDHENGKD